MPEQIDIRELIEQEADNFISKTGKFPKRLLLGYDYYLVLYNQLKPSVLVPVQKDGKDVGAVDICKELRSLVLGTCDLEIIADPDHKNRITFLVSNEYSAIHQAKEVVKAVKKIQAENKAKKER